MLAQVLPRHGESTVLGSLVAIISTSLDHAHPTLVPRE